MEAWHSPDSGFWNELSARDRYRKMYPALSAHSGMQFPFASHWESAPHSEVEFWDEFSAGATLGKCIPLWSRKVGRSFPERSLWESMSHSGREFRDVLSAWSRSGNGIPFWSQIPGSTFHQESQRESASHSEHQFWDEVSSSNRLSKERVHSAILQNRLSRTASPTGPSRHRKRTYIRIYSCNLIEWLLLTAVPCAGQRPPCDGR